MSGDQLREQGIAAAKAGRKDEARQLLSQAAELNPRDAQAWLFLASVTDDKKSRLLALRHVLEHHHEREHTALAHELPLEVQEAAWRGLEDTGV